jgi:hypothetical protein
LYCIIEYVTYLRLLHAVAGTEVRLRERERGGEGKLLAVFSELSEFE